MHDKQMNRVGFESSAFWVIWADQVLKPSKKSDKKSDIIEVPCGVEWVQTLFNNGREDLPLWQKKKGESWQGQSPTPSAHTSPQKCQSSPSVDSFRTTSILVTSAAFIILQHQRGRTPTWWLPGWGVIFLAHSNWGPSLLKHKQKINCTWRLFINLFWPCFFYSVWPQAIPTVSPQLRFECFSITDAFKLSRSRQ